MLSTKPIENILKGILLIVVFVTPLIYAPSLYYPYASGKAYFFRLLIELALIPWIILLFKKPDSRPKFRNLLVIALLVFTAVLIITAFTGVDVIRSFFSNIERSDGIIQYIHYVLYFLMAISVFRTKKDWQIVLSLFILTALINCLYAFSHHSQQLRLFGLLGNSSYLGGFLIFTIGFCLLFLVNAFKPFKIKTPKWFIVLIIILLLLFTIALVLTQTRGAYFGVFLGFVIFVILANFYLWKKSKKAIIILNSLLFIALALSASIFIYKDSQFVKKFPIVSRVAHTAESNSAKDRLSEWSIAIKGFKDKPILGWGPENFDVVANKYYDYRVGLYQPWFDRPHNQALQYLAEGGIVLFTVYLFLIAAVIYSIFKIFKREKVFASILSAIYIGYIIQSLILFDALPMLLGLFTLLALIYFLSEPSSVENIPSNLTRPKNDSMFFVGVGVSTILILILVRYTVFIPFTGNRLIIDGYKASASKDYKSLQLVYDKVFSHKSPYLYANARRSLGWLFLNNILNEDIQEEDKFSVVILYKKITPELENWLKYRPVDQQAYYVLGSSYRIGFEKLGFIDDLAKAETVLKKSLDYSAIRIEYIDALGQVFILEKKLDELDELMKNFIANINQNDPYRYLSLGHSYFMQGKYDLAMEEYEKARSLGQQLWTSDRDYYRYLQTAEQLKDWQKVVDMTQEYLKNKGEDADTLYNLAVAYYYLGDKEKTKEYFERAVILDPNFEQERKNLEEVGAF